MFGFGDRLNICQLALIYCFNKNLRDILIAYDVCGCSSVVERHLPKVNVVGSSPIIRFMDSVYWLSMVALAAE